MPILLDLFLTFAKIGAFTFGGGYAMLSVISDNCVEKKKWITAEDIMNTPESITGDYLAGRKKVPIPKQRRKGKDLLRAASLHEAPNSLNSTTFFGVLTKSSGM